MLPGDEWLTQGPLGDCRRQASFQGWGASQGLALPTLSKHSMRPSSLLSHRSPVWMSEWGGDTTEEPAGDTSRPGAQEVSGRTEAGTDMGWLTS